MKSSKAFVFQLFLYNNTPCNQDLRMVYFLKNYKWEQIQWFPLSTHWILIKFSWVAERRVSSVSMLKFAHSLWTLCRHSFWCVVLTGYNTLLIIYMLVKFIIMKANPLLPIRIFLPNCCHAVLLPQDLGARANSGNAHKCVLCMSILSITFIILWRKPLILELGALEDKWSPEQHKLKKEPPHHTEIMWKGCTTIMLFFSRSSYLMSLLNRLLIWNLLCQIYAKIEFLTFYSRKWSLFLMAYIAYTFKLVILRYTI